MARLTEAGAVTTRTRQKSHSHQLDTRGALAVLAAQHARCCWVPYCFRDEMSQCEQRPALKVETTELLRLREPNITPWRVCVCVDSRPVQNLGGKSETQCVRSTTGCCRCNSLVQQFKSRELIHMRENILVAKLP